MKGKRKLYTPQFKFKVVLESLQRDTTLEEICCKFGVSSSMISRWRQAFQQYGPGLFADQCDPMRRRKALGYDPGESPDDLKKLIGELTVQYVQCKRPKADKEPAVRDEAAHEKDDTMDHRTLAALRRNREESDQASNAHIWDRCPTQTRSAYVYRGLATEIVPKSAA
jgi:transposase